MADKQRDIDNAKLEEMIADPAISAIYESFDFGDSDSDSTADRKEKIRNIIKERKSKARRRIQEQDEDEGEDEDEEFTEEDFLDVEMDAEDVSPEIDDDLEVDDMGEYDPEEAIDPQTALTQAQSALDDIENYLADDAVVDVVDEDYGEDDEFVEDDIFIEDEEEYAEPDEEEVDVDMEESRRARLRKSIKERIQRKRLEEKIRARVRKRMEEKKKGSKAQPKAQQTQLKKLYKEGVQTRKVIVEAARAVKAEMAKPTLKESRARTNEKLVAKKGAYIKAIAKKKGVSRKEAYKTYHKMLEKRFAELKKDYRQLQDAMRKVKEALYSTGGPAPGEQVEFPKAPKKTQTGIQKQKNTKTEFPKKAKSPQKGHNWPTHGTAAGKEGEAVKKPGKFPGKDISRQRG